MPTICALPTNERLVALIAAAHRGRTSGTPIDAAGRSRLLKGMDGLKMRAKTLVDLAESALFYVRRPAELDATRRAPCSRRRRAAHCQHSVNILTTIGDWTRAGAGADRPHNC